MLAVTGQLLAVANQQPFSWELYCCAAIHVQCYQISHFLQEQVRNLDLKVKYPHFRTLAMISNVSSMLQAKKTQLCVIHRPPFGHPSQHFIPQASDLSVRYIQNFVVLHRLCEELQNLLRHTQNKVLHTMVQIFVNNHRAQRYTPSRRSIKIIPEFPSICGFSQLPRLWIINHLKGPELHVEVLLLSSRVWAKKCRGNEAYKDTYKLLKLFTTTQSKELHPVFRA